MMTEAHDDGPDRDPFRRDFPSLPIVTPDDDRLSNLQKYGGLYPLGIAGLAILGGLIAWFAWAAWSLRGVWADVYVLHDAARPTAERVAAAYALGRSADVNQRQRWDIALRTDLPPLARYAVAEGLTAEAVSADPRGYGLAVAKSEGWPDWLRFVLARPLAYAAALGEPVPADSLRTLAGSPDRATALIAAFALAAASPDDRAQGDRLRNAAGAADAFAPVAADLIAALDARRFEEKLTALDSATLRLRTVPPAAALWSGWAVREGRLIPAP